LSNIIKFKGTENLTEIDIALAKLLRTITLAQHQPRRVCVDLLSDVLLQHHAVATRRWLSRLIQELKSKGFTTLAVVNPRMHPPEELEAVLDLFDGEIRITEKEAADANVKTLRVLRLQGQNYLKDELNMG
jgi:KaiC/GvpD/RAD55 family RecA-like ATPase